MNNKWNMDQENDFDEEIRHIFQESVEIPEAIRQAERRARNIMQNKVTEKAKSITKKLWSSPTAFCALVSVLMILYMI